MIDTDAARWRRLALLALAVVGGMSTWFAGSVAAPLRAADLALTPGEVGWLVSTVQLGFVVGTLVIAVFNIADVVPGRRLFAVSAVGAAIANAALLVAPTLPWLVASRLVTGLCLAGVYPPAMKMAATWFRQSRGLAIGSVVGALTIGKALPYLLQGNGAVAIELVVLVPSVAALAAAFLIGTTWQDGPHAFPARPFHWGLIGEVVRDRPLRRVTGGYLGHMWELYAFWAWVPGFLTAAAAARGEGAAAHGTAAFTIVGIGAVGCVGGGLLADRFGRRQVVRGAMLVSGTLAALSPLLFGAPTWLLMIALLVWGIAVIADSAQFSALATELAPPHAVGTALALQTSLGFLLTIASIQLVPMLADTLGWRWALAVLAVGPFAGWW
ncbi:MAG: MFS transporter [Gemmatimonadetes bacterium]|nr:MFS transporter [Gemmatimonadota bacterium]